MNYQINQQQQQHEKPAPYVKIIEQPARCALRFRYECEGRSAGSIPGASSTSDNKTYPTISIINYKGPAVVVVSCITKDLPYRAHPHNLVGKEGCKKGVCTLVIDNPEMICTFTSLGIQCVKRKDVEESLKQRELIKVDPFRTGFAHKSQASNIDLNVVRLCFQVFLEGPEKGKFTVPLAPVVCEPIYDKKAMSELIITKLSHCSATVTGGKEVILLCDRVTKDDVQVRFYEERNNQLVWEAFGEFQPNDVHKQVAICFRTPRYYDETVQQPVLVHLQLRRPSDMQTSDSRPFQLLPREIDPEGLVRKRQKLDDGSLDRYVRESTAMPNIPSVANVPSPVASPPMDASVMDESIPRLPAGDYIGVPRMVKVKNEADNSSNQMASWNMHAVLKPLQQSHLTPMLPPNSSFNFNPHLIFSNTPGPSSAVHDQHTGLLNLNPNIKLEPSSSNSRNVQSNIHGPHATQTADFHSPNSNSNTVENALTERLDSLDLDIDPNDLMSDINFNNLMVMMDSGNNIQFNSSGNIAEASGVTPGTLHTPQLFDSSDNSRNMLASASQRARLQELMQMQANRSNNNQAE